METIRKLEVQFNKPVTTDTGPGYLVALGEDGRYLICVWQATAHRDPTTPGLEHGRGPCCHLWFDPDQVVFS